MTIEHKDITDVNLHNPKGFGAASANQILSKNATGTAVEWIDHIKAYGCIYMTASGTTTGIDGTFKAINNATIGGTLTWTQQAANNITVNATSGYYSVDHAGTYMIASAISFAGAVAAANTFQFTIGISLDSEAHATIHEKSAVVSSYRSVTTTDVGSCAITCQPTVSVGDRIYLMVKRTIGSNQIDFQHINHVITKVD